MQLGVVGLGRNAARLIGHEVLSAVMIGGRPPVRPRARTPAIPSLTRCFLQ